MGVLTQALFKPIGQKGLMLDNLPRLRKNGGGGGSSASIFISGLSETDSVSMITPSGKTLQGVWRSKKVLEPYEIPILTSNDSRVISNNNSSEAWQVFDSDYQTGWNGGRGVANAWVGFNTARKTAITHIYLDWTQVGSTYWTGFDGEFQVSDDGINWTKVQDIVSTGFTISVDFDSPIEGQYFRLLWHRVNSSYSGGHCNIYTISGNGYSVATVNGWIFDNLTEYGTYVITASNGTKTKTQDVLVDMAEEYSIEMDFRLWLYKYGDECEGVTGGWSKDGYYFASGQGTAYDCEKKEDSFVIPAKAWSSVGLIGTVNAIPMNGYSKFVVISTQSADGCSANISAAQNAISNTRLAYSDLTVGNKSQTDIDISNIDSGYVSFVRGSNSSATTVYAVWLEE